MHKTTNINNYRISIRLPKGVLATMWVEASDKQQAKTTILDTFKDVIQDKGYYITIKQIIQ